MKKRNVKVISSLCVIALTTSLLVACGTNSTSSPAKSSQETKTTVQAPVEISIISSDSGRVVKEDSPVLLEIQKRTNTIIKQQLVPTAEFVNKYNVLVASGSVPDITALGAFGYQQYAQQGIFLEIKDLIEKNAPNIKKIVKPELFELVKLQGKLYSIPKWNDPGKYMQIVRRDWLDNLGLKAPSTLDEFEDMLKKFTFNDPDKNGKNDTFGLGGAGNWGAGNDFAYDFCTIFGAFGMEPNQYYMKDNKITSTMLSNEYKAAIEYIKKLWDAKVIDPEIFTIKADQANQKLVQSKSGSVTAWWSQAPGVLMQQLKMNEVNPNAKWDPLLNLKGKDGKNGLTSQGDISGTLSIAAKTRYPVETMKLIDFIWSDEGYELSKYGIKGLHYTELNLPKTDAGKKANDEKWLDALGNLVNRLDFDNKVQSTTTDPVVKESNRFKLTAGTSPLYSDIFYGIPITDEFTTLNPDLKKYNLEWFIKFVTGEQPLSKWDEYIAGWKSKGGQKLMDSMIKKLNEIKNTNYTSGM